MDATTEIISRLKALEEKIEVGLIEQKMFGDWIPEKKAIEITGIGRSTFLKLRQRGKLSSSTLSGKQTFVRMSEIKKLLDKNEQER